MKLQEAYEILKANARYSSGQCEGFVYLSQIEELLEFKPTKYNQELVEKVRKREIVIEVDGFEGIKDLINYIYPDDPYREDGYESKRFFYYTHGKNNDCYYWGASFYIGHKEKVKAIEFLVK